MVESSLWYIALRGRDIHTRRKQEHNWTVKHNGYAKRVVARALEGKTIGMKRPSAGIRSLSVNSSPSVFR